MSTECKTHGHCGHREQPQCDGQNEGKQRRSWTEPNEMLDKSWTCEDPGAEALSESLFIVLLPTAGAVILSVFCSPSRLPPASPSLIRTLQHNARRPRQWALCIIHKSEARSAACVSLALTERSRTQVVWCWKTARTWTNRCIISKMIPGKLGTAAKGNCTAIN